MAPKPDCSLCHALNLVFAALKRDRESSGPRIHLQRMRVDLERAQKDHMPEHHQNLSAEITLHNFRYAGWLTTLAAQIHDHHDNATTQGTGT